MVQIFSFFVDFRLLGWSILNYVEIILSDFGLAISPFLGRFYQLMVRFNRIVLKLRLRLFVAGFSCLVIINCAHSQCIVWLIFDKGRDGRVFSTELIPF